jgi:hypothetical protein
LSPEVAESIAERFRPEPLTLRELTVLRESMKELSDKGIANRLSISVRTIKNTCAANTHEAQRTVPGRGDSMRQHASTRRVARIMSAAFSAIMMVGALVLAPISVGMIEASITRSARLYPGVGAEKEINYGFGSISTRLLKLQRRAPAPPQNRVRSGVGFRHAGLCQGERLEFINCKTSRRRELLRLSARRLGFEELQVY